MERAHIVLEELKELAECSKSASERVRCPVKRDKSTSGEMGFHQTLSKLFRKRLQFESKQEIDYVLFIHCNMLNVCKNKYIYVYIVLAKSFRLYP